MRRRLKHYVIYLQFVIFFAHLVVVLCDLCCICNEIGKRGNLDKRSSGAYKRCLNGGSSGGELFCDRKVQVSVKEEERDTSVSWKGEGKMPITDLFIAVKKERDLLSEMEKVDESKGKNITADLVPYIKVEPEVSSDMIKNCDIKTENDVITVEEHVLFQEDTELYANLADVLSCLKNITPATEGKNSILAEPPILPQLPQEVIRSDLPTPGAKLLKSQKSHIILCRNCSCSFPSEQKYFKHTTASNQCYSARPYRCNHCSASFKRSHHLTRHEHSHNKLRRYSCRICSTNFLTVDAMRKHKISFHKHLLTISQLKNLLGKVNKYQCHHCLKWFQTKSHISEHMRVHTGERPFECKFCKKCFKRQSGLQVHMSSHAISTVKSSSARSDPSTSRGLLEHFDCDACGHQFFSKASLSAHISRHCSLKCSVCSQIFPDTIKYRKHVRLGGCNWLLKCKLCDKGFGRERNLSRHMRYHRPEYFLECDSCKRHFKRKTSIIYHFQRSKYCKCM
ncbi:zinc finger protein OZF-like isoform X2 [Bacillus rossius redtenbacheri]|uniref:zinc finger protein OZF-like isoform X2 n=1 Tax=Bacillus rossius redtenbacheri TaxID=93214 RepID=UPI002FDEE6C0